MAVQLSYMKFRWAIIPVFLVALLPGCKRNPNPTSDFLASPLTSGSDIKLSTDYKDKPVVVYLWATWCGPCKQFAPTLNSLADKYQPKGIPFLAISGEPKKLIAQSELKEPHRMTVLVDTFSSAAEAFGGESLPTIAILDKEHKMVWGSKGISQSTESNMRTILDGLI